MRLPLALALVPLLCGSLLDGARLLALFPMHSRSHWTLGHTFLKALAARGHNVTFVTSLPSGERSDNWREVVVPDTTSQFGSAKVNMFDMSLSNPFLLVIFISNFVKGSCNILLGDEEIQKLYHSDEQFDAVISEDFWQECLHVFAHKFDAPLIQVTPYEGSQWMGDKLGNPSEMAYVPDPLLNFPARMGFGQRLTNVVYATLGRLLQYWHILPAIDALVREKLNDSTIPSVAELERRTSLILMNTHVSISHPRPLLPNMVMVGGMHVKPPKELPKDLRKYLDEAEDGVVYFSMGSNLKSADMPEEKRAAFLEAFSGLRQRVLWKWEDDRLPGQPANVRVGKWLPQADILAHKNVKLFITHGGLLSSLEALHHGVPLIAIPIFGDQALNAQRASTAGYAVKLNFLNVTTDSLRWALSEVLGNPRYTEKAKHLSKLFHDRPRPPMEEAIHWTEYVIRHRGARHMRSAALDLAWYQYLLLDVAAVALSALAAVGFTAAFLARALIRLACGKRDNVQSGRRKKGAKKD